MAAGDRFSIRLRNGKAHYYKNYQTALSTPFYVSPQVVPEVVLRPFITSNHPKAIREVGTARLLAGGLRRAFISSAGMQVEDFGSTQPSVKIKVYPVSALVGRGQGAEAIL